MERDFSLFALVAALLLGAASLLASCEFVDSKDGSTDSGYYYDTGDGTGSDTGEYYY